MVEFGFYGNKNEPHSERDPSVYCDGIPRLLRHCPRRSIPRALDSGLLEQLHDIPYGHVCGLCPVRRRGFHQPRYNVRVSRHRHDTLITLQVHDNELGIRRERDRGFPIDDRSLKRHQLAVGRQLVHHATSRNAWVGDGHRHRLCRRCPREGHIQHCRHARCRQALNRFRDARGGDETHVHCLLSLERLIRNIDTHRLVPKIVLRGAPKDQTSSIPGPSRVNTGTRRLRWVRWPRYC